MDLYAELRSVVEALDRAGVAYALVGGLAVSIYTVPRATEDIDLMLAREDVGRAVDALGSVGFKAPGRAMSVAGGRLEIQRLIKIQGTEMLPLDLLVALDRELAALIERPATVTVEGRPIRIVRLESLRALKRLRGSAAGPRRSRSARTGSGMNGQDAAATLQRVAALRALCLKLPHLPTPAEAKLLERFAGLVDDAAGASDEDIAALAAGWRDWWGRGRARDIVTMAARLPAGIVDGDRRLASYLYASSAALTQRGDEG